MQLEISVSKIDKFGVSPGGDTVEVTERPTGGLSVVFSDGQGSGAPAKAISSFVVSKAISMIADGSRDGAVARAVHDALYARRRAQVSATLTIISADTSHGQLVVSRNSNCPVMVFREGEATRILDSETVPIGTQKMIRPDIEQFPLFNPQLAVAFSDGILAAGKSSGKPVEMAELAALAADMATEPAVGISRKILEWALDRDGGRAADDISVVALKIERKAAEQEIREMSVRYPL